MTPPVERRSPRAAALIAALLLSSCSELPVDVTFDARPEAGPDQRVAPDADGPTPADGTAADASPAAFDWRDGIIYFVMLDRFSDGDSTNNSPVSGAPQATDFRGGDLAGLLQKLKAGYFSTLGVNVLWLSSPVDAPDGKYTGKDGHEYTGYHGYWPTELTKVEERLGDLALLGQVVTEAHKQKIAVLLDYVMNHVHSTSTTYTGNKSWFWSLTYNSKTCVCGKACSWSSPEGLRCWFDSFLPSFDFTQAAARKFSVDNAVKWIQDTGIDGFRLDAVKHIETTWLTDLRARLFSLGLAKPFLLMGETFDGSRDLLKKYINPSTMLDGQFDFPMRAELVKTILLRKGSFADLDKFLNSNDGYYGTGAVMGTFLGNHDLPRIIHLAEDSPQFTEWDTGKAKAWSNTPSLPTSAKPFERLAVAYTALMTLPGIPLIYYGDEVGMAGGGDPDNRRPMTWSGTTADQDRLKAHIASLTALRNKHPALRRGSRKEVWISSDAYAYKMSHASGDIVVVLNRADTDQTIKISGAATYQDLLNGGSVTAASIKVPARSSMVLK